MVCTEIWWLIKKYQKSAINRNLKQLSIRHLAFFKVIPIWSYILYQTPFQLFWRLPGKCFWHTEQLPHHSLLNCLNVLKFCFFQIEFDFWRAKFAKGEICRNDDSWTWWMLCIVMVVDGMSMVWWDVHTLLVRIL